MSRMAEKESVLDLARKLIAENPYSLKDPDGFLKHLEGSFENAAVLVEKIVSRYPQIPLIKDEVALAAGLHDIGRPLRRGQLFHELRGAKFIEEHGSENDIVGSVKDAYRIAQMLRPHAFVYEQWIDPKNAGSRKGFEPMEISLLVPRTWQEKIVTVSEATDINGENIDIESKLDLVIRRYEDDPDYQSDGVAEYVMAGKGRIYGVCEMVHALAEGRLSEKEIARYGFI